MGKEKGHGKPLSGRRGLDGVCGPDARRNRGGRNATIAAAEEKRPAPESGAGTQSDPQPVLIEWLLPQQVRCQKEGCGRRMYVQSTRAAKDGFPPIQYWTCREHPGHTEKRVGVAKEQKAG